MSLESAEVSKLRIGFLAESGGPSCLAGSEVSSKTVEAVVHAVLMSHSLRLESCEEVSNRFGSTLLKKNKTLK